MTEPKSTARLLWNTVLGSVQLGLVALTVGGAIFLANYMQANQPERVQIETRTFLPAVQTETVTLSGNKITLTATGTVEPSVYVNLTPEVSGVVSEVLPGLGSGARFAANEILFRIDPRDLDIEVQRREADLASAHASLDIERAQSTNAVREWEAYGRGEITDLAARGPQVRSAEAQVLSAEAGLETARLSRERAGFSLPFDGRIVEVSVAPGQKVTAGQSYGRAHSFDAVEVRVSFPPDNLSVLDSVTGTQALVLADILGRTVTLPGVVTRLDGEISRTTRLATLIISMDPARVAEIGLLPGAFATVTLVGPEISDVAVVPNAALQEDDQLWMIVDGVLRMTQDVTVVQRGRETSLVTGLPDGAEIAVGTIAGAVDGMKVSAMRRPQQDTMTLTERQRD